MSSDGVLKRLYDTRDNIVLAREFVAGMGFQAFAADKKDEEKKEMKKSDTKKSDAKKTTKKKAKKDEDKK